MPYVDVRKTFVGIMSHDRVAQSVEHRTSRNGTVVPGAFRGNNPTAECACRELLERPESHVRHSVTGNGEREGKKSGVDWAISRRDSRGFMGIGFRD